MPQFESKYGIGEHVFIKLGKKTKPISGVVQSVSFYAENILYRVLYTDSNRNAASMTYYEREVISSKGSVHEN